MADKQLGITRLKQPVKLIHNMVLLRCTKQRTQGTEHITGTAT